MRIPTLADILNARRNVDRYLKRTPLIYSRRLSRVLGFDTYLKLENLQPVRSFKVRGGVHFMVSMLDEALRRGVITASTGNHAQSIAYAGSILGVQVKIVMPSNAPQNKVEAVKELGAEVIHYGAYYEEAREYSEMLAERHGHLYVHGINEPLLYEGVGTMHLEILEEMPYIDAVINPIGGGSGAGSAVIVYKSVNPRIRIYGVQAEGAPAFYHSWKTGSIVRAEARTKAEGLATSMGYELPLRIMSNRIDDVVLVSDREMMAAVKTLLEATGQLAELAGAASTAAAFKIRDRLQGLKIALNLTGGNLPMEMLDNILHSEYSGVGD
ncbi:L-threonine dehydratase catabolic TdcB [archaeon HR01]|nr:L-threonine dehydratase catabolic TdcB [archaeon HR01]